MSGVPIVLQCGVDWWMQFSATDPSTGLPVAVTNPRMEIRHVLFGSANSTGTIIYTSEGTTPGIVLTQPSASVVLASIAGTVTKNQQSLQVGAWDAYATDPNGRTIQLGAGTFTSTPNVAVL